MGAQELNRARKRAPVDALFLFLLFSLLPETSAADQPAAASDTKSIASYTVPKLTGNIRNDVREHAVANDESPLSTNTQQANPYLDPVSEQGQKARGLYFCGPVAGAMSARAMAGKLHRDHLDTAVIDVKDDQGRVTYQTAIAELQPQVEVFLRDARRTIRELHEA